MKNTQSVLVFIMASLVISLFLVTNYAYAANEVDWTGFYAGINSGVLINDSHATLEPSGNFTGNPLNPLRTDSVDFDDAAYIGGVQAGYNHQFSKGVVVGLEADFNYSSLSEKDQSTRALSAPLLGTLSHTIKDELLWFGTVRPRVGWSWKKLLIYATGGFAYGQVKSESNALFSLDGDNYAGNLSKVCVGWTAGAGLEGRLAKNWSLRMVIREKILAYILAII